ncbi:MAG: secretin N-terminal domain-containing protein [Candidatus Eisenbacteria bacterium]
MRTRHRRASGARLGLVLIAVALLIGSAPAPSGGDPPASGEGPGTITLSAQDIDIREVLAMFARSQKVNIVSGGEVTGRVSIEIDGVPFEDALHAVVSMAGYQVVRKGDIYYIHRPAGEQDVQVLSLKEVYTYRCNYAYPEDVRSVVQNMLSPIGQASSYAALRTIIVEDRPDVLARIDQVVRELDRAPRQVLIEARIIEARMSKDSRFGIDWSLFFSHGAGEGDMVVEGFAAPANSGTEGLFMTWGEGDFTAALQGLEGVDELNSLAAPRLLAIDGRQAEIIIGGQLGFSVVTTVENTVIQSVQFLDTGAQLRITPIITDDGYILMKIHPELSDGVVEEGLPSKTTTEVSTEVLVKDGHTLLIGGLIREREEENRKGIPVLRRIPILGNLFGSTVIAKSKSELITLITPHILEPGEAVAE